MRTGRREFLFVGLGAASCRGPGQTRAPQQPGRLPPIARAYLALGDTARAGASQDATALAQGVLAWQGNLGADLLTAVPNPTSAAGANVQLLVRAMLAAGRTDATQRFASLGRLDVSGSYPTGEVVRALLAIGPDEAAARDRALSKEPLAATHDHDSLVRAVLAWGHDRSEWDFTRELRSESYRAPAAVQDLVRAVMAAAPRAARERFEKVWTTTDFGDADLGAKALAAALLARGGEGALARYNSLPKFPIRASADATTLVRVMLSLGSAAESAQAAALSLRLLHPKWT